MTARKALAPKEEFFPHTKECKPPTLYPDSKVEVLKPPAQLYFELNIQTLVFKDKYKINQLL